MKNSNAGVALAAIAALLIPGGIAFAKDYTQIGTASVGKVNAKDDTCKPEAGKSATGTATATSRHQACTDAKNNARATLRGQIPAACAKYVSSGKKCKDG